MTHKLYDVVIKTGEYTNSQNELKSRYENIGSMMQGDNGPFLILKSTFNIAGVPNPEHKDSVIASLFEPKQQGQQQPQQPQVGGFQQPQQPQSGFQQQQGYKQS